MSAHLKSKHQLSHSDAVQVARGNLDLQKAVRHPIKNHFAEHKFTLLYSNHWMSKLAFRCTFTTSKYRWICHQK